MTVQAVAAPVAAVPRALRAVADGGGSQAPHQGVCSCSRAVGTVAATHHRCGRIATEFPAAADGPSEERWRRPPSSVHTAVDATLVLGSALHLLCNQELGKVLRNE